MSDTPRTALVTGSAQGIGAAIAIRLRDDGFRVIGVDVDEHGSDHPCAATVVGDVADLDEMRTVVETHGPIDVLVNNAAVLHQQDFPEVTPDDFDFTIDINLKAAFFLSQLVVEHMRSKGWGRIINISSVAAREGGRARSTVYAVSKGGLLALTKNLAAQYAQDGITVNAITPGAIDTRMGAIGRPRNETGKTLSKVGRRGQPSEVAAAVGFLAGESSSFVTGVTIDVNGGWVMV